MTRCSDDRGTVEGIDCHKLLECRWGCKLTEQACRSYQSRTPRYVIHFNVPWSRVQR